MNLEDQQEHPSARFYRNGQDHRGGWLVNFHDVKDRFGFKSVRIGRWVSGEEKEDSAPRFYDALCDLMSILKVPEQVISLRQTLSLDYGTGGQYGVAAHYTPANRTFALAKNAGPGSIAHEWFHAFDHFIGNKVFRDTSELEFASVAFWNKNERVVHPLNQLLLDCYAQILMPTDATSSNVYVENAKKKDEALGQLYYSQPYELCARAFEAYVQDSSIKNNFLVKGTKQSLDAKDGLYPTGYHRVKINRSFATYFLALGQALGKHS